MVKFVVISETNLVLNSFDSKGVQKSDEAEFLQKAGRASFPNAFRAC